MVSNKEIERAAAALRRGELVAFPTETVYGLGADASNPEAVKRIFQAKGRPADHPVIVHLARIETLSQWAREVSEDALRLAERFMPGPLTLILPRADHVLDLVTGGQNTVGLRVPGHPIAQQLLEVFGSGVAAPSANRFGRISPTRAEHVREELGDEVSVILEGGDCEVGLESTIVALTTEEPQLLRPGAITLEQLEKALNKPVLIPQKPSVRASGTLESHYAPRTPVYLLPLPELLIVLEQQLRNGKKIAVFSFAPAVLPHSEVIWNTAPDEVSAYARSLYSTLRELDKQNADTILIESPPNEPEWRAVNDRLRRASTRQE